MCLSHSKIRRDAYKFKYPLLTEPSCITPADSRLVELQHGAKKRELKGRGQGHVRTSQSRSRHGQFQHPNDNNADEVENVNVNVLSISNFLWCYFDV